MNTTPPHASINPIIPRQVSRRVLAVLAVLAATLAIAAGCGDGEGEVSTEAAGSALPDKYTFTGINQTDTTIYDVLLDGLEQNVKFTKIAPGSSSSLLGPRMPMPSKIDVSWSTGRGPRINTYVVPKIPKNFNGNLIFTIKAGRKVEFSAGTTR